MHMRTPTTTRERAHTEIYVTLIGLPWQHLFGQSVSQLRYKHIACLVCYKQKHKTAKLITEVMTVVDVIILCSIEGLVEYL